MKPVTKKADADKILGEALKNRSLAAQTHALGYARRLIMQNSIYSHLQSAWDSLRHVRLVAFFVRLLTILFALLQTGSAILLSTLLFLVALPLLCSLLLGVLLTAFLESGRSNRILEEQTKGRRVYVLFPVGEIRKFTVDNARSLASRNGACVIIVSPHWISSKGISRGYFYCTSRTEEKNIYIIRRYYFYSLCKHVLQKRDCAFLF